MPMGDEAAHGVPHSIGAVAHRALATNGFHRLDDLRHATRAQLLVIHGVGPKAVRILEAELQRLGWSLAP